MNALVLFDFDGTLADTAPDLAAAANMQRHHRGLDDLPYEDLRPYASHGARGLLGAALGMTPDHPEYEATRLRFLADYEASMTDNSHLFPGIAQLLTDLADHDIAWGNVTNKATRLAVPIIEHLGLAAQSKAIVCGDTTAHSKPHPEPLLHAARTAGYSPHRCLYVGDDLRDIQAGRAAGMPAIAAAYGYCSGQDVATWQADVDAHDATELLPAILTLIKTLPDTELSSASAN